MLPAVSTPLSLIVNPHSGRGKGLGLAARIQNDLMTTGRQVDLLATASLEHAEELAVLAATKGRIAVAVGGDGLISTVASAVSRHDGSMAVVPAGRGNDFVRALGLTDRAAAIDALTNGEEHRIDMGAIGDHRFLCVASLGIDRLVVASANRSRRVPGKLVYPLATVGALRSFRPVTFQIRADGNERELRGYSCAVANTSYFGGGMKIAPDARHDDGLLDIVVIGEMSCAGFLMRAPRVFSGSHVRDRRVTVIRADRVEVRCEEMCGVVADGEVLDVAGGEFEVLPGALRMILPV